jgi:Flp pilus assembly protein TadD
MKWFTSLAAAGVLATISAQAGPDEDYISIYQMIEDADAALANNNLSVAATKFATVQAALTRFKAAYPNWNQGTVDFRAQYVAGRIATLPAKAAPAAPVAAPVAVESVADLKQAIAQLQEERRVLNAKLQEALAAQPAAIDPLELKKAEGQIATLQKEKELLRVALEQEQGKVAKAVDKSAAEQEIAKLRAQLAAAAAPTAAAERELANAREAARASALSVASLQLAVKNAQDERDTLLARLKVASETSAASKGTVAAPVAAAPSGTDAQVKQLEKERDELRRQLSAANSAVADAKASASKGGKGERGDLANRTAILSARLQVLEARSIPYTPEELAALKQGPLGVKAPPAKGESKRKELPAGAGIIIAEAQRAYAQKNFALAEEKYKEILKIDDKNVMTLGNLGVIQLELGRVDDAEATLTRAQSLEPDDAFVMGKLGVLRFRQNKFDDALNLLSRAADLDPKNPEVQNFLGMTLSEKGLRQPAETALRKAVELAPGYATAHHNLAVIYASQQPPFLDLARYHYQKSLDLRGDEDPVVEKMLKKK